MDGGPWPGEGHAAAALTAVDRALEVVRVDTLPLARQVLGHEHRLELAEDCLGDEGWCRPVYSIPLSVT
jgi:hypothetical protein